MATWGSAILRQHSNFLSVADPILQSTQCTESERRLRTRARRSTLNSVSGGFFDSTVCDRAGAQAVGGAVAGPVMGRGRDRTPLLSLASRVAAIPPNAAPRC